MKNSQNFIILSKRVLSFLLLVIHGYLSAQNCYYVTLSQSSVQFPLTGGTSYVTVSPAAGCSSGVITASNVPSWVSVSGGSILTITCSATTSYRSGSFTIMVNGSTVNGITITQGTAPTTPTPTPPACSISGFPSTITVAKLGETKSYSLSFSNCSAQYVTEFKTTSNGPLPNWLTITQPSPSTINVVANRNDTGALRSVIIHGNTPSGGSVAAMITQEDCLLAWYEDSDGDGFGDALGTPVFSCERPNKGGLPYQYVQNNNDNCPYIYSTVNSGCQTGYVHENFNWITADSYDSKGALIASSKSYFDDLGKPDVSLSKDFVQNKVWGTETLYDSFGRPYKTSFVAPSPLTTLQKVNFFKTPAEISSSSLPNSVTVSSPITANTTVQAMDLVTGTAAIGTGLNVNFNAKTIVLKNGFSVTATAGSSFKATPVVFPDNSVNASLANYYSDSNTLELYQATAEQPFSQTNYDILNPGNIINIVGGNKINGDWKTGYSYTVPAAQEMYYVYGSDYYEGPVVSGKEEVITKFYKSVSVDANGVENVAFSDGEGKILASARSGGSANYPVVSLIGNQGFVDVHIPAGISSSQVALIGAASLYKVYDLKTGAIAAMPLTGGKAYRVEALSVPATDPKVYITAGAPTPQAGALGITYRVNYYDYAVNVYNKTGQLLKSIQPNGYVSNSTIVANPAHMTSSNFASTFKYNALGQLTETTSPDEGTSRFAYRKDGQIRYSQSALQADTKISYTDYDTLGRPVESGVVTGTWASAIANPDGSLLAGTRSEQTFTIYDYPENNTTSVALPTAPTNLTLTGVLTTAGISSTNYIQNNLSGNVAVTYTKPAATITAITWYSYDLYGRAEWVVQYNEGIGAKTIHYEYDYKGNVKKVLFQKDKTSELFVHRYSYDANSVLNKVETSTNNTSFITHADYSYYLTGELKRVNIAQGTQGLDYVYTLGGQLKSINHPSLEAAKDPGGDANDVFGLTLDYYKGDYLRTGRNITASPTIGADYNGNIKASRWANKGIAGDYSGSTANQKGYLYNYGHCCYKP
jgi:YD repeat-containing protein